MRTVCEGKKKQPKYIPPTLYENIACCFVFLCFTVGQRSGPIHRGPAPAAGPARVCLLTPESKTFVLLFRHIPVKSSQFLSIKRILCPFVCLSVQHYTGHVSNHN